jgi:hypothetical protein
MVRSTPETDRPWSEACRLVGYAFVLTATSNAFRWMPPEVPIDSAPAAHITLREHRAIITYLQARKLILDRGSTLSETGCRHRAMPSRVDAHTQNPGVSSGRCGTVHRVGTTRRSGRIDGSKLNATRRLCWS